MADNNAEPRFSHKTLERNVTLLNLVRIAAALGDT